MRDKRTIANPVLGLPSADKILHLPQPTREALAALLVELGEDAQARADKCWRTHKAPMAAYWKAVGVYARHIARALRRGPAQPLDSEGTGWDSAEFETRMGGAP